VGDVGEVGERLPIAKDRAIGTSVSTGNPEDSEFCESRRQDRSMFSVHDELLNGEFICKSSNERLSSAL